MITSSRPEMLLNIFQNQEENTCVRVSFFLKKTADLGPGTLLKIRHFDRGVFL